jgi:hypothetical protein
MTGACKKLVDGSDKTYRTLCKGFFIGIRGCPGLIFNYFYKINPIIIQTIILRQACGRVPRTPPLRVGSLNFPQGVGFAK